MSSDCKRCLLAQAGEEITSDEIKRQLALLPPALLTSSAEYDKRLKICKGCDYLISGTCRKCGCYVEYRAGISENHCPDAAKKW